MRLVDTVEIGFGNPSPRLQMLTIHRFVRSLGVTNDQVFALAPIVLASTQVVRLTFHSTAEATAFLDKHKGVSSHDLENRPIQVVVKDPNEEEKFVRICDFPANENIDILRTRFSSFGTVLAVKRDRYQASVTDDYFNCWSGHIVLRMTLSMPIPNYVKVGDFKVYVRYQGQPPTCRVCNLPGHLGAACPTRPPAVAIVPAQIPKKVPPVKPPPPLLKRPTSNIMLQVKETVFPPLPSSSGASTPISTPLPSPTPVAWGPQADPTPVFITPTEPLFVPETPLIEAPASSNPLSTDVLPAPILSADTPNLGPCTETPMDESLPGSGEEFDSVSEAGSNADLAGQPPTTPLASEFLKTGAKRRAASTRTKRKKKPAN